MPVKRGGLILGFGINDTTDPIYKRERINGKDTITWSCPIYQKWKQMLRRCYEEKYQQKNITYIGCYVCEEWRYFSNFKKWILSHREWEGKELDKDILVMGNKEYSPDRCLLVRREVNIFFIHSDKNKGIWPLGVSQFKHSKKFRSNAQINHKRVDNSSYCTPIEAHRVWQLHKIRMAKLLVDGEKDTRVISGIRRAIDKIQSDYDKKLITEDY